MKISKFLITLCLLVASLLTGAFIPSRADAGASQWTTVITPDSTNNLVISPSEVNVIAVTADGTLFASDIPRQKVYRSTSTGYGWSDVSNSPGLSASLPVWNIRTAPDNPLIIVAVGTSGGRPGAVIVSTDGGSNWQNLDFPGGQDICSLDISPFYGSYDILAGTRDGLGGGRLFVFKMSGTGTWADQGLAGDILDARFSPNYGGDNTLAVVYATASGTFAGLGLRDVAANASNFGIYIPVEISTGGSGTSPKANQIRTADLELPSDFNGQVSNLRKLFVSTNDSGITGNAGVFRIDDNMLYAITPPGNRMISSISYFGTTTSGKLLEGEVLANISSASVDVQYCLNAAANCPLGTCLVWQKSLKLPTGGAGSGNANAQVLWSRDGTRAYCGTSSADLAGTGWPSGLLVSQALDESAFSFSPDAAVTWNQAGLIDTQISFLSDVTPTPATDTVYLSSINSAGPGFDSLWRRNASSSWERILCLQSSSNRLLTRINPLQPNQVFLAVPATSNLQWSPDKGQSWTAIQPGTSITDFQVSTIGSTTSTFILSDGIVRRGDYSGSIWKFGSPVNTGLLSGYMIYVNSSGIILVGDTQGTVAFSADAGSQFGTLPPLPSPGNVSVLLDERVKNPYLIIAATDNPASSIYAWIPGASSRWLDMQPPLTGYYGLAQLNTFYGCASNGSSSGVVRTLQPEQLSAPEWDVMDAGLQAGVVFTRQPSALSVSAGVVLLAIDNRPYSTSTGRLWQYGDAFTGTPGIAQLPPLETLVQAPVLSTPVQNAVIEPTISGQIPPIEFSWQQPSSPNGYDLWIAKDPGFNQVILRQSVIPGNVMTPKWILDPSNIALEPGQTYYWRVRVNRIAYTYQKVQGDWSATYSFRISAAGKTDIPAPAAPVLLYPRDNSTNVFEPVSFKWLPVNGASEYEFKLASDPLMKQLITDARTQAVEYRYTAGLEKGTTYYWQVTATQPAPGQPSQVFSFIAKTSPQTTPVQKPWYTSIPLYVYIGGGIILLAIIVVVLLLASRKKRSY